MLTHIFYVYFYMFSYNCMVIFDGLARRRLPDPKITKRLLLSDVTLGLIENNRKLSKYCKCWCLPPGGVTCKRGTYCSYICTCAKMASKIPWFSAGTTEFVFEFVYFWPAKTARVPAAPPRNTRDFRPTNFAATLLASSKVEIQTMAGQWCILIVHAIFCISTPQ